MTENKEEDKFTQLLGLAHTEELIRFRRRSEKRGLLKMAESLTAEIEERLALEREEYEKATKKK
jgi:hypothetical protein